MPWGNRGAFLGEGIRNELMKGLGLLLGDSGEALKKNRALFWIGCYEEVG